MPPTAHDMKKLQRHRDLKDKVYFLYPETKMFDLIKLVPTLLFFKAETLKLKWFFPEFYKDTVVFAKLWLSAINSEKKNVTNRN